MIELDIYNMVERIFKRGYNSLDEFCKESGICKMALKKIMNTGTARAWTVKKIVKTLDVLPSEIINEEEKKDVI